MVKKTRVVTEEDVETKPTVDIEAVEAKLKLALSDCKEAQLQRDFLRDNARAQGLICPICKHGKKADMNIICNIYKKNKAECKWIRCLTQCIPVKEGNICRDMEYQNPNISKEEE